MFMQILLTAIFVVILLRVYQHIRKSRPVVPLEVDSKLKVCIVLGSGGHTTEMLRLVSSLGENYSNRLYLLADSDTVSEGKLKEAEKLKSSGSFEIFKIPRSREVRQSYLSSIPTTLYSLLCTLPTLLAFLPDLVLCNGPGTCIPVATWGHLLDLFLIKQVKIVFVESICRVQRLSLSGMILYYGLIADKCLVQWQELGQKYGRAEYIGRI